MSETRKSSLRAKAGDVADPITTAKSPATLREAMDKLMKYSLVPEGTPIMENLIVGMKLLVSSVRSQTVAELLLALVMYAEKVTLKDSSEHITAAVSKKLNPLLTSLAAITEQLTESATATWDSTRELMDTQGSIQTDSRRAVEELNTAAKRATDQLSYAEAAGTTRSAGASATVHTLLPTTHATTLAREDTKARQVLLDRVSTEDTQTGSQHSEELLLQKANLALEAMDDTTKTDAPTNPQFKGLRILPNGGLLYEMNTKAAASWLRTTRARADFLRQYDGGVAATMKDRSWQIFIDFTPCQLNPSDESALRGLEDRNDLPKSSIVEARWIKPPEFRNKGQRTALLLMSFGTPAEANRILRDGIYICGKKLWARKNISEPKRCLKCQQLGVRHYAVDCKSIHDVCGSCASIHHNSKQCNITDPDRLYCVNCKTWGHASWDRSCPTFLREKKRLAERQPELKYRYYPQQDDPSSWELLEEIQSASPPLPSTLATPPVASPYGGPSRERSWADQVNEEYDWQTADRAGRHTNTTAGPPAWREPRTYTQSKLSWPSGPNPSQPPPSSQRHRTSTPPSSQAPPFSRQ